MELTGSRDYSEAGPLPLKFSEIQAWSNLTGYDLARWEVDAIKAIDHSFLTSDMIKKDKK